MEIIQQQYKHELEPQRFEFKYCDPWDWALQSIRDPHLQNHIVWGPEKSYQWNENSWKRFFDEL